METSRQIHRRLIGFYILGSAAAVVVVLFLVLIGLEFSGHQWAIVLSALPITVLTYVVPDILMIRRQYRPLGDVLTQLDRNQTPTPEATSWAIVRALNLPYFAFLRVVLFHGPGATISLTLTLVAGNAFFHGGFLPWQVITFASIIFFFASPTHAILEFFAVSKEMVRVVERLYPLVGTLAREPQTHLRKIGLRKKLLYLAIFVTSLPLLFLAGSVTLKVSLMTNTPPAQFVAFLIWVYGVVAVCVGGALIMSVLTAAEVSRSAARLARAMNLVEGGDLEVRLQVTSTDEYADLFRGFNHMTDGLREEVKILGISNDLAGELQLDVLLSRIMQATTELLDADRSTLWLHDAKTGELFTRVAQGVDRKEIRIPVDSGIAGAVFATGQAENIHDAHQDPRFNPVIDRRTGYRTRTILAVPVVNKTGARIGVTQVLNKHAGDFTTRDEQRLRAFTAQLAVALENAQLFDAMLAMKNYNESILRSSSNGIITLDSDRRIVTVNEAAASLLKRPATALIGHKGRDVLDDWVLASVAKVATSGASDIALDADLKVADGTASVNLTCVPLLDAAGKNIGSMLILDDISGEKRMRSTMSRYMSKEVADQLIDAGEAMLGGREQRLTVLFSDIRGFTTLSEAAGARETVSMLNEYFAEMVEVLFSHRGILDKYIGDAIMALFGAPFTTPEDADNAVRAANQMIVTLRQLNALRASFGKQPIRIGVGLNTGDGIVGSIGSPKRMEYTVIGDTVNLASRIEGACKTYGVSVILTEFTLAQLKHPARVRRLDLIRVKGKTQPVAIFEGLDHHDAETFPALDRAFPVWEQGIDAYTARRWAEAATAFGEVLALHPGDTPSQLYLQRCAHLRAEPPPDDWDGVWTMTHK